jgi:hypothetical protein
LPLSAAEDEGFFFKKNQKLPLIWAIGFGTAKASLKQKTSFCKQNEVFQRRPHSTVAVTWIAFWDISAADFGLPGPHECQNDFCTAGYKQRDRKML